MLCLVCAIRGGALWVMRDRLGSDPDAYRAIATQLAAGKGYSGPSGKPTAFRPPGYPIVLSVPFRLGWGNAGIATMHFAFGIATVWLTYRVGLRLGMSRAGATLAAFLVGVDPLLVQYSTAPMTETVCALLGILLISVGINGTRSAKRQLFVGVVFGGCVLCRPTFWAFGALSAIAWVARRRQSETRQIPWVTLLAVAIVVSPWVARNTLVMGRPIVMTTHGGYTLLLGNNEVFNAQVLQQPWGARWSGASLAAWQRSLEAEMERDGIAEDSEIKRDRWHRKKAMRYIREHPDVFYRACALRFVRFWNVSPPPAAQETVRIAWCKLTGSKTKGGDVVASGVVWLTRLFYIGVTVAFLFGVVRKRDAAWRRLMLLVAAFVVVHLVYWSNTRMRAPVIPAIVLVAVAGISPREE